MQRYKQAVHLLQIGVIAEQIALRFIQSHSNRVSLLIMG